MRFGTVLSLSPLFASSISAHYYWPTIIVNGTKSKVFEYVREVAEYPGYVEPGNLAGKSVPAIDIYSTNFTCGRLAFDSAAKTKTADVVAGSTVGFKLNVGTAEDVSWGGLNHYGPAQAYLAKPPNGDLETFSGIDGDWFKVDSLTAKDDSTWIAGDYSVQIVNITIPAKTPPGKYLLRFEQFWPRLEFMQTQWFINCAHINVIGPGGGSLDGYPFAKFPGSYDYMDPSIWVKKEIDTYPRKGLLSYVAPGPAVWKG